MLKKLSVFIVFVVFIFFGSSVFAIEVPKPPVAPVAPKPPQFPPQAPQPPVAPEPPQFSGDFEVPEVPGLRVRVFSHPPKPIPSATPVASSNPALVCGLSDPDSSFVALPTSWHLKIGAIPYRLNVKSVPSGVSGSNLNTIVTAGFSQYSQATGNRVVFSRGADTSVNKSRYDGQNVVAWNRLSQGTLGITYVWYWPSTGEVAEVDTIMNTRYKWSWSNSNVCADSGSYDAQNIMTHELGHWLGLNDHYDSALHKDLTMYGYGATQETKKNTLTSGDKTGVLNIYSPL